MPINFQNALICDAACPPPAVLPLAGAAQCNCTTWNEGINELYFIDCDAVTATIETDFKTLDWWRGLITANNIYRFGIGTGAIQVKNPVNRAVPDGCGGTKDIRTNTEWSLTYEKFCIDKTVALTTHEEMAAIARGALKKYNLAVRYCEAEFIAFVGAVSAGAYDAPHNGEGLKFTYEFNWKSKEPLIPFNMAGLNGVIPKATASY